MKCRKVQSFRIDDHHERHRFCLSSSLLLIENRQYAIYWSYIHGIKALFDEESICCWFRLIVWWTEHLWHASHIQIDLDSIQFHFSITRNSIWSDKEPVNITGFGIKCMVGVSRPEKKVVRKKNRRFAITLYFFTERVRIPANSSKIK